MTEKPPTYSKQVIEIADYIFKNPDKKREDVLANFGKKWQKGNRTIDRYYANAKEYNQNRLTKQEQAKSEVMITQAKETAKQSILSRYECLEILSNIAKGSARKVANESLLIPNDSDRTRAIQQLAKMEGWDAPVQVNSNTTLNLEILTDEELKQCYRLLEKVI